jgi:lysophosphatidylcholine acyltransferase/lyso-PAF acetyltransferase
MLVSSLLASLAFTQVTYLPVMHPTEAEKANPPAFAARVQRAMADALGVGITEHSFADTRLMFAARKLKLPLGDAVLEMDKVARLWGASYSDCRDALERFAAAGGARTMRVCTARCSHPHVLTHARSRVHPCCGVPCRPARGVAERG